LSISALEREVAQMIVDALDLEGVDPETIEPDAPLFNDGLGLDSIDALEIALAISQRYGFQLKADDAQNKDVFSSLRALSDFVDQNRSK